MSENIDVRGQEISELSKPLLEILLKDRTTGKNIVWATDCYAELGDGYAAARQMSATQITGKNKDVISHYNEKTVPSWKCNIQNNLIDDVWFGRKNLFNVAEGNTWQVTEDKVNFENMLWPKYVESNRLEVCCGEAPHLVSRYDTESEKYIEVADRIGMLDRKLRIINEQAEDEEEWYLWVCTAYQSIYGYEYRGDKLLLARINLLYDFVDNYRYKFKTSRLPAANEQKKIAEIISWNIWQMENINYSVPYGDKTVEIAHNMRLFTDGIDTSNDIITEKRPCYCIVKDWKKDKTVKYAAFLKTFHDMTDLSAKEYGGIKYSMP